MSKQKESLTPEWSHPIDAADLDPQGKKIVIEANDAQRAALANRLGVARVQSAKAELRLTPEGARVHVAGHLSAKILQNCAVTLEPIESGIEEEFEAWYADPGKAVSFMKARHEKQRHSQTEMPVLEESDDPEEMENGMIDVGELATQYFSLAINPYPHAPGAQYEIGDDEAPAAPAEERKNPFAALKDWKSRYNKDNS